MSTRTRPGARTPLVLASLALLPLILAGCVRSAEETVPAAAVPSAPDPLGPLVEVVTDAAGDAYEAGDLPRDGVRLGMRFGCFLADYGAQRAGLSVEDDCNNATGPYDGTGTVPRFGRAADPALDVLSVSAQASGDTVVLELETASIVEDLSWVRPDSSTIHQVCWDSEEPWMSDHAMCAHGVVLWVQAGSEGTPGVLWSAYVERSPRCTSDFYVFRGCAIAVPYSLEAGGPGKIRWELPRAWLGDATRLAAPFGVTSVGTMRDFQVYPFYSCACPRDPTDDLPTVADATAPGADFVLPPARLREASAPPGTEGVDPVGDLLGRTGVDAIDILSTTLTETGEDLTFSVELAEVPEAAPQAAVVVHFGLPGRSYWAGLRTYGEDAEVLALSCVGRRDDGWCAKYADIPVDVERRVGAPGRIDFAFARSDLGFPVAGDVAHTLWSVAYEVDGQVQAPPQLQQRGAGFRTQEIPSLDFGPLLPATRLSLGEPPRIPDGLPEAVTVEDPSFDWSGEGVCILENCRRFDIAYVEVSATSDTGADVTIGISDLSAAVRVPVGYHAVVYAAALRTEEAQTMVGYSRNEDNEDKFFCGPDNLVLVGTPLDPAGVASTPISGVVTIGRTSNARADASGAPGSITIHVPHECFGKRAPGALHAEAVAAGTYAVSNPSKRAGEGSVDRIDSVESDEAFTIASVAPPLPPPPPWYARDIFWNAFGAFLAVVTVAFTIGIYVRRRNLMQWYLSELSRVDAEYRGDAIQRAKGILALRKRLHHDIVKHRVSDSEYIRDRMRASLTSARLVSLSDDYFDLPAPLTLRIERVLDDGRMTAEEAQLVEKVMNRVKIPEEGRALLVERVRTWVVEDADWG